MKITRRQLRQLIREEAQLLEANPDHGSSQDTKGGGVRGTDAGTASLFSGLENADNAELVMRALKAMGKRSDDAGVQALYDALPVKYKTSTL
jgi:hypothetical protein